MPEYGDSNGGSEDSGPDTEEMLDSVEPEIRDGPMGLPIVVPKGCPDLPGVEKTDYSRSRR